MTECGGGVVAVLMNGDAQVQGNIVLSTNSLTLALHDAVPVYRVPVGTAFLAELMYAPDGTPSSVFDQVAMRGEPQASSGTVSRSIASCIRKTPTPSPAGGFGLFHSWVWVRT